MMGVMIAHMCLFVCVPCQVISHKASLAQDTLSGGLPLGAIMHHRGLYHSSYWLVLFKTLTRLVSNLLVINHNQHLISYNQSLSQRTHACIINEAWRFHVLTAVLYDPIAGIKRSARVSFHLQYSILLHHIQWNGFLYETCGLQGCGMQRQGGDWWGKYRLDGADGGEMLLEQRQGGRWWRRK